MIRSNPRAASPFSRLRSVLVMGLLATLGSSSGSQATNPGEVVNLRIPGQVIDLEEPFLLFAQRESWVGRDQNGDGDTSDRVAMVLDLRDRTVTNLAQHVRSNPDGYIMAAMEGQWVVLNGDDGTQVVDLVTRELVSLGRTAPFPFEMSGSSLVYAVRERNEDLNGDGDFRDGVVHVFRAGSGEPPRNLGLATDDLPIASGDFVAFSVREFQQGGVDLNGNGSILDEVMHVHDMRTGVTTNLGVSAFYRCDRDYYPPNPAFAFEGPLLSFFSSEEDEGRDLNGDGDLFDVVIFVYDSRTGVLTNLQVAYPCYEHFRSRLRIHGDRIYFPVIEFEQGFTDLNGDGDIFDHVIHVYDASTGEITNLELAGNAVVCGELVALEVDEVEQDLTDLNGDGDFRDAVMHVLDPSTGEITNLGVAVNRPITVYDDPLASHTDGIGKRIAFPVDERDHGETDLDGDGEVETRSSVLFVHDAVAGRTFNTGLGWSRPANERGARVGQASRLFFPASRLNDELTPFLYDGETGVLARIDLPRDGMVAYSEKLIAFSTDEEDVEEDLNLDGDLDDRVLHIVPLDGRRYGAGSVNSGQGPVTPVLRINGQSGTVNLPSRSSIQLSLDAAPMGPEGKYILWGWPGYSIRETELQVQGVRLGHAVNPTSLHPGQNPRPYLCVTSPGLPEIVCDRTLIRKEGPVSTPFTWRFPRGLPHGYTMTLQGVMEDDGAGNPTGWSVTNAVTVLVRGD